jgi:ribonucleoside-diphosphate reductase alpha chain
MDISQSILSDITVFNKYARYYPELQRRETWEEIVDRNKLMHIKMYPQMEMEIRRVYRDYVRNKKVLPSMRSMQFGGAPIELANNRVYNCCYLPAEHIDAFSEMMFLLLGGTGVGYSVQKHHVAKLPVVQGLKSTKRRFLVGDSIEGWADAVKVIVEAYFKGKADPEFDYRGVRQKGARLVTAGGKAPGPDPLRICIDQIRGILSNAVGRQLMPIEVHDIMCHIADAVLSGGIRRAALIALFSRDDLDMLSCKTGAWWELNPQRGRANNSAVLPRDAVDKEEFLAIWQRIKDSESGEPGIFWTNDIDMGTNPCCEIALKPYQFCNLTEINASDVATQEELNARSKAAAFIGTIQAGYTNFHYLRPIWKETSEAEALIGVGMTGIASGGVLKLNLAEAANEVLAENRRVAALIGINPAARTTCVKPSGTTSLVLGSSSGIHAWHAPYYIRRMRVGKNEALYRYMKENFPMLIEDCKYKPHLEAVMSFPQKAPDGAITRDESFMQLLERVRKLAVEWVNTGHVSGNNSHNVSCTISLKDDEWGQCAEWMWEHRGDYNGISVLPFDGGSYIQAPFEDCDEATFNEMIGHMHAIDITQVVELDDETALSEQAACAGGACEINFA